MNERVIDVLEMNIERKKLLREKIRHYFLEEFELDLGLIGQQNVLDFFLEEMGEEIYNTALDDALLFIRNHQQNMESDFYTLYKNK